MNQSILRKPSEPLPAAKPCAAEAFGHIVSVTGPRAVALLSKSAHYMGDPDRQRVQIGAFLKIETPACAVLGLVTGASTPLPMMDESQSAIDLIELNLVGEISRSADGNQPVFRRGVANPPSIGDALV